MIRIMIDIKIIRIRVLRENKMGIKDLSQEDVIGLLDTCYTKCLDGIPKVSPSIEDMANDYLTKYDSTEDACKAMLKN